MSVRSLLLRALLVPAVASVAACNTESSAPVDHSTMHMGAVAAHTNATPSAPTRDLAKIIKAETARFSSQVQATKAGYAVASPCVAVPGLGGMGFHWVNQSIVDPIFQPGRPEAVLYDTNNKLVAVEYIVIDVGQPRPSFNGQPFDIGGTPVPVPHYSLHVWLHLDNPSGMFAPFNPALSCS
jgi:hypothetical protein